MTLFQFSERTFRKLPLVQQHRKCALMLEKAYLFFHQKREQEGLRQVDFYNACTAWLTPPLSPLHQASPEVLSERFHFHASLGEIQRKEHNLLPCVQKGDRKQASPPLPFHVYLDHIRSAHNVGSILRTVEAFSLGTVYFSANMATPTHKQVRDAAMGADEWVSCKTQIALEDLPRPLIALETVPDGSSLWEWNWSLPCTLILGNEEVGCSEEALQTADAVIRIPLRGRKNSLNVANAFAIVASEVCRTHTTRSSSRR